MNKVVMICLAAMLFAGPVLFIENSNAAELQALELKDGRKVQVEGKAVYILNDRGEKKPAPDGTYEVKEGQKLTTRDGKVAK